MLDIEKYRKQINRLNDCLSNLEDAIQFRGKMIENKMDYDTEYNANELVEHCHFALIGQLKLMNMQNEEELKS